MKIIQWRPCNHSHLPWGKLQREDRREVLTSSYIQELCRFHLSCGTVDQIFTLAELLRVSWEFKRIIFVCFGDLVIAAPCTNRVCHACSLSPMLLIVFFNWIFLYGERMVLDLGTLRPNLCFLLKMCFCWHLQTMTAAVSRSRPDVSWLSCQLWKEDEWLLLIWGSVFATSKDVPVFMVFCPQVFWCRFLVIKDMTIQRRQLKRPFYSTGDVYAFCPQQVLGFLRQSQ